MIKSATAKVDTIKARVERLGKKLAAMEQKLSKRTGDAQMRLTRKRLKRAQRRLADLAPKKTGEAAAKPA